MLLANRKLQAISLPRCFLSLSALSPPSCFWLIFLVNTSSFGWNIPSWCVCVCIYIYINYIYIYYSIYRNTHVLLLNRKDLASENSTFCHGPETRTPQVMIVSGSWVTARDRLGTWVTQNSGCFSTPTCRYGGVQKNGGTPSSLMMVFVKIRE